MVVRPTGTVTFLFTDIEGSTKRWEQYPEAMRIAVGRHDTILRQIIEAHNGYVFKTIGDAFCAAFATTQAAVEATVAAQRAIAQEPWGQVDPIRVRMALHSGSAEERDDDYFGSPVNRVARLLATGHGGQVLLSLAAEELVRDSLADDVTLVDLGAHRLKDLQRSEHIFQLAIRDLPTTFPALKTLDNRPNNLTIQPTLLIGREKEVAGVCDLLRRPDVRLVTLLGFGGTGKTRLSLQVAADMIDEYPDGVFFVQVAALSDPALVAATIVQTLDVREVGGRSLIDALKAHLREKQMLLVLDNFEQVITAAPLVSDLLTAAPRLKILITSRRVLQIYGEREFPVPPLPTPDPRRALSVEALSQFAAVQLFIERAQAVKPDFGVTNENAPAVAEICHRLNGFPLAIELAAARIRILSPQAMLARLDSKLKLLTGGSRDLPARQQTLRGAIDWSYDLLDSGEKHLFQGLAIFVGGCTLEAAEAVCNPDGDLAVDVLDGISSLVSKSLLRQEEGADGEARFSMLEAIREYALEALIASGNDVTISLQYANYYLALVEATDAHLRGSQQVRWLNQLEQEYDNLRAVLQWAQAHPETEVGLRLATVLAWFWEVRGYFSEGRQHLTALLARPGAASQAPNAAGLRARALNSAGTLAYRQADYAAARTLHEESLNLWRSSGDAQGMALSLHSLANISYQTADWSAARDLYEKSLALRRESRDAPGISASLNNLAILAHRQGDHTTARTLLEESLALRRLQGDKRGISTVLHNLGEIAVYQGDYAPALALFEEGLTLLKELKDRRSVAVVLDSLGWVELHQAEYARAHTLFAESLGIYRDLEDRGGIARGLNSLALAALYQGDPQQAALRGAESLRQRQVLGDKLGVAESLETLAGVALVGGQLDLEAHLVGVAETLRQIIGAPRPAPERALYERQRARHAALPAAPVRIAAQDLKLEQEIEAALAATGNLTFA